MTEADAIIGLTAAIRDFHETFGWLVFWIAMAVLFKNFGGGKRD